MARPVYIETTVISYLTAWPSRDIVRLAHQQLTKEWWDTRRGGFDLYVSQAVVDEASGGDPIAAAARLVVLAGIPLVEITDPVVALARKIAADVGLPTQAAVDALHIACSAYHGMAYLITWNCRHIANAVLRRRIEGVCTAEGYEPPIICTPEELLEEE